MSTDSPSSDAERPKWPILSEKSGKDAVEFDLWDLDSAGGEAPGDDDGGESIPSRRPKQTSLRSKVPTSRTINAPVIREETAEESVTELSPATEEVDPVAALASKITRRDPVIRSARAERSDLDDLDDTPAPPVAIPESKPHVVATPSIVLAETKADEEKADETAEASPPLSRKPTFLGSLTTVEKIGLVGLLAILAIAAALTLHHFNRVPTRELIEAPLDLPIQGQLLTATEVKTFWREPILSGEKPDTVRRGTQLIPVLELSLDGKPAAVRVFFRNDEGLVVGDGITRSVSGEGTLEIPATAGFDDVGMHAAYRTGESIPWVVEVFEAPNPNVPSDKFQKLFETKISTDIR